MSTDPEIRELWGDDLYPPYVTSEADRHRWDVCLSIATTMSEVNEPSGVADRQFVWYTQRWLYASGIPIDDEELDVKQAVEAEVADEYTQLALERLDAQMPPRTAEEAWREVDYACDVLDAALGDPAGWDLGEYEEGADERLLMEGVDFRAALHPRDRVGRWAQKLAALRRFVAANRHLLTGSRGKDPAAERALHASRPSPTRPEGHEAAAETEARELARREGITEEQARARIVRAARSKLSAGAERAGKGTHEAVGAAIGELASAHAKLHTEKHIDTALGGAKHDADALFSHVENVAGTAESAGAVAHWAAAHSSEIHYLFTIAHHIMKMKGLSAAALEDEGEPELPIVESVLA